VTPPAATAAGRTKTRKAAGKAAKAGPKRRAGAKSAAKGRASTARASGRPNAGHGARTLRRSSAPRVARRVSGPAGGRAAAAAAALPRPQLAPLGPRLVAFATTLPDRSVVDRMVRGRLWIGVLGVLLIGLVFTQVSLLKLNAGIGSAVERSSGLERINGELRAQVSQLESGERIQERAAALGMVLPAAGQISYVRPRGRDDVGAATRALDQSVFNDPTKATPLPGADSPPDPLTTALTEPSTDETSTDGTSTDGTSTDGTSTDGTSTDSQDTSSTGGDTSSGDSTDSTDSGDSSDASSTGDTGQAAAVSGGTGTDGEGQ
jgi:cell division protein FtsL